MPCYVVEDKEAKEGEPRKRLVEANNRASARNHVARDRFAVKQASPHDISEVVKGGGDIEVAGTVAEEEVELEQPLKEEPVKTDDQPIQDKSKK